MNSQALVIADTIETALEVYEQRIKSFEQTLTGSMLAGKAMAFENAKQAHKGMVFFREFSGWPNYLRDGDCDGRTPEERVEYFQRKIQRNVVRLGSQAGNHSTDAYHNLAEQYAAEAWTWAFETFILDADL